MTIMEAEKILNVDKIFFPYSKRYLDTVYKCQVKKIFSGNAIDSTNGDYLLLKKAYNFLIFDGNVISSIFDSSIHIDEGISEEEEKLIADFIFGINDGVLPQKLMDKYQEYYFALCELVPEEELRKEIQKFGGIRNILKSRECLSFLADKFEVSICKIQIRLIELYLFDAKGNEATNNRMKKVKFLRKRNMLY